jgi:hypothetical protein
MMPVPVPPGTPTWINIVFLLAGLAFFAVLIWQAVRYFRQHRDED